MLRRADRNSSGSVPGRVLTWLSQMARSDLLREICTPRVRHNTYTQRPMRHGFLNAQKLSKIGISQVNPILPKKYRYVRLNVLVSAAIELRVANCIR
ncbi:hypothetical protein RRG08_039879 [Elysia crispata]|uniref:Uncharacterized protein n=1 Tax=Elysia crispata TaxID=231223 RepID=A0AAE0ZVQ4_9GAST|nr:hypothetical protein RRG08_039879 [Elysia crispata]